MEQTRKFFEDVVSDAAEAMAWFGHRACDAAEWLLFRFQPPPFLSDLILLAILLLLLLF